MTEWDTNSDGSENLEVKYAETLDESYSIGDQLLFVISILTRADNTYIQSKSIDGSNIISLFSCLVETQFINFIIIICIYWNKY